jgi:hypothetical protein
MNLHHFLFPPVLTSRESPQARSATLLHELLPPGPSHPAAVPAQGTQTQWVTTPLVHVPRRGIREGYDVSIQS